MNFPSGGILIDLKESILRKNPRIFSLDIMSKEGYSYHDSTPLDFITEESFCISVNNTDHYMVLKFEDEDIFDNEGQRLRDMPMQQLLASLGSTIPKRAIISNFVNQIVDEILKNKGSNGKINGYTLRRIIEGKIQQDALAISTETAMVNQLLAVLHEKKKVLEEIKDTISVKFAKRAKRRVNFLYALVLSQIAFTQYGTYVKYSWDIMEPICCLFGIFDSFLAYAFYLANNSDYNFEKFEKKFVEDRVNKYFGKNLNISETMEDIDAMISHLNLWKSIHSDSLPEILEALDQKFVEEK